LYGAIAALREAVGFEREPVDQPPYETWIAETKSRLGKPEFTAAWSRGQSLTLDDAVNEALAIAREVETPENITPLFRTA
jgi:hypothetical protein